MAGLYAVYICAASCRTARFQWLTWSRGTSSTTSADALTVCLARGLYKTSYRALQKDKSSYCQLRDRGGTAWLAYKQSQHTFDKFLEAPRIKPARLQARQ